MAQNKVSVNLSSADFNLSFSFKGPSVVIPGQDQNFFGSTGAWGGDTPQKGVNIPQVYYCENTVPTAEGYRSVAYRYFIPAPDTGKTFVKFLTVFDGEANSALLGITADLQLYIVSPYTNGEWEELALPEGFTWETPSLVTTTTIIGFIGVCIQGCGIFALDVSSSTLFEVPFTGIEPDEVHGICSSNSILIAWDTTRVYWSSTLDPTDFTPSLITGAGSGTPEGLKGKIVLCKEISGGFIVYSDVHSIGAEYTQNNALPWLFSVLQNSAGIRTADAVGYDINMYAHFAWTSAGLVQLQVGTAELLFPQVTDFIATGLSDSTTTFTDYPKVTFGAASKEVRLAAISNRYLCISFGYLSAPNEGEFPVPLLTQSFVFDSQLRRWGKLNADHVQILETSFNAEPPVFF